MNKKERMCMIILKAAVFLYNTDRSIEAGEFMFRIETAIKDYTGRKVLHQMNDNHSINQIYFDNYIR